MNNQNNGQMSKVSAEKKSRKKVSTSNVSKKSKN
jgi:hypothetical protein